MATVAWILLFDAAFQLSYSFVSIPYGSLSAAMTENGTDRSRLAGGRSIASSITGVALSLVVSPQFEDTTVDDIRLRLTTATVILALIALVLYWICFRNTREVVPRGTGTLNLRSTLRMVRRNKPLLVLCVGALFLLGGSFTMNAVMMYYARSFSWPTVEVNVPAAAADARINSRLARENTDEVIRLVKNFGGVVVGRDATVVLAGMAGALHVRLEAPDVDRMARAIETEGLATEVAAQRLLREDRMQPRMSRRVMGWDPADHSRYDLVIDTSETSLDEAVDQIVAAVDAKRA